MNLNQFSSASLVVSCPVTIVTTIPSSTVSNVVITTSLPSVTTNSFPFNSVKGAYFPPQGTFSAPSTSLNIADSSIPFSNPNGSIPFPNPSAAAFPYSSVGVSSSSFSNIGNFNVSPPMISVASVPHSNFHVVNPPAAASPSSTRTLQVSISSNNNYFNRLKTHLMEILNVTTLGSVA